jgi:hypothetical protein
MTPEKAELISRLERAQKNGGFPVQACELDDLAAALFDKRRKGLAVGKCHLYRVTAYRIRSIAVMTDEKT